MASAVKFETLAAAEEAYLLVGDRAEDDVDWNDPWLDEGIGAMQVGGLYTFAARKGTGKSFSMLRQLLMLKEPSMFISLEDPRREVGRRVAAAPLSSIAKERVRLYIPARPRLKAIVEVMHETRLLGGKGPGKDPCRVIGVDYLQIIQDDSGNNTFDRAGQVRNVITELKGAAREYGQSIILNAQLRRPPQRMEEPDPNGIGPDSGGEPRGTIFDIRDSSDVENQSDAVVLIHRLGRTKFDQTLGAVKSRVGGDRRTFVRGPGGWPEVLTTRRDPAPSEPWMEELA